MLHLSPEGNFSDVELDDVPGVLAIDREGKVIFTAGSRAIGILDTQGSLRRFPIDGSGFFPPDLALDEDGMVWFTEPSAMRLGRLSPRSGLMRKVQFNGQGPASITVGGGWVWYTFAEVPGVCGFELPLCAADCDESGYVTVDELVSCVSVALGRTEVEQCAACDTDDDGKVTVGDLIRGVGDALERCG